MADEYGAGHHATGGTSAAGFQQGGDHHSVDPTTDGASQQSEWDRLWDTVRKNPEDFPSWELLLKAAEAPVLVNPQAASSPDKTNLRTVYDHFLNKFPLCFGYWKKYADWEFSLEGADKAQEIFERGVVSIHNSVDLWTQYCSFKVQHFGMDESGIRSLFERAADAIGLDFISHTFWDKYIEYEESKQAHGAVISILERIIHIPLHQYARYFEKYSALSVTRPISELITQEEYKQLDDEIRNPPPKDDDDEDAEPSARKTDDQVQAELRQRIHTLKSEIYMRTQEGVHKRWVYESEIKRPYFHVKPLDEAQLSNWRKYLDFEEVEGDTGRIYFLYERCLVTCALYEEFWQRYIRFLLSRQDTDGTRNVFIRATNIFIPPSRPAVRLAYATFEEQEKRIEEARELYTQILAQLPGHVETAIKLAHFERRQGGLGKAVESLNQNITAAPNAAGKAFLTAHKIKMSYAVDGNAESARSDFEQAVTQYSDSRFLWLQFLLFEIGQCGSQALTASAKVWTSIKDSELAPEDKRDLGFRYLDYLLENAASVDEMNEVDLYIHRDLAAKIEAEGGRKRGMEDDYDIRPVKQLRVSIMDPAAAAAAAAGQTPVAADGATPTSGAGYYGAAAGGAYNPYAGYDPSAYAAGYYGAAGAQGGWDYSQQPAAAY
ncbi:putative mRNA splicing protein [Phlyctochytrium arcticum]|nr:putative mRNA splicing protein [Phlyctochytrium arcticum]